MHQSSLSMHQKSPIIAIGGGVGNLVCSSLLAKSKRNVILLEKNDVCGGRMNSETISGYRFDTGPSLLLMPDVYKETFVRLGADITDYIELLEVKDPLYRIYYDDKPLEAVDICRDVSKMKATFESLVAGEGESLFQKYRSYLGIASAFLSFGWDAVIEERPNFTRLPAFLLSCVRAWPLNSHVSMLEAMFGNASKYRKIVGLLSFQNLYIGLSPSETPAIFSLLQALEFEKGIYYPKGGFKLVAESLTKLALSNGVQIQYNTSATLLHTSDKDRVTHVELASGSSIACEQVVVNVDSPEAEILFINQKVRDERTACARPSCGIVSLSFGLNRSLDQLTHHTLFLSTADESVSWRTVRDPDNSNFNPTAFNFYCHAPARTDKTACPEGHDAITVLVPVPPLPASSNFSSHDEKLLIDLVRKSVIKRLEITCGPIKQNIVCESIRSPLSWKRDFNLFRGSAFGLAHCLSQLSLFRPRLRHPRIRNLFRVGASTRPGNGVPLVMVSGRLTSDTMLTD